MEPPREARATAAGREDSERGLTHRMFRSMAWTAAGTAVELPLQLIVVMVLARVLAPADFGVVSMAHVATSLLGIVGQLGLGAALIQRERLEAAHVRTAFTTCVGFGVVAAAILWLSSPVLARFFATPMVAPIARILAVALVLKMWGAVPTALLERALRFRDLSFANVLSYVVGFGVVGVGLALAGFGGWALAWAYTGQVFVQSLVAHVRSPMPARLGVDPRAFRELLAYGGGITFAEIANLVALRGDNVVVGYRLGATALGLYGPAYQLMALPAELFQRVVQIVLFPAVSRVQAEPARLAAAFRRALAVTSLAVLPGTALVILLAPELVAVLLGPQWTGVVAPLRVLAAGMFFRVGYKTSAVFVKAVGAAPGFALRHIPYPIMVVSLSWLGSPWGIEGVAAGVVTALGLHDLILTAFGLRLARLRSRDYLASHGPALLLTAVVLAQASLVLGGAHHAGAPAWASLAAVGLSTGLTIGALIWWMPARVLGTDGLWLRRSLAGALFPRWA